MTVAELVEHLKGMPQDARVVVPDPEGGDDTEARLVETDKGPFRLGVGGAGHGLIRCSARGHEPNAVTLTVVRIL